MNVQEVLAEARQLSPIEQLDLIRALSAGLQVQYLQSVDQTQPANHDAIPSSVKRTQPVTNLDVLVADFWPDDESIDELSDYIRHERAADRLSDQ
jgi:hypothetical protein